ncbi:MAG: SPFH domain-containing protein, partial [Microcystaceae cyanobacterium]
MSSLLSAIAALVSWIVFFTIKSKENAHPLVRPLSLVIGLFSSAIFVFQIVSGLAVIIPAGEVGVMESLGQVDQNTLSPGIYFVNPFTDIITYSTRLQDIK